mmetsp:Transcript_82982/g.231537  ORF Transcript_82982/g.231537 Transcript_82982/m.231537 type:complete len:219 (+) Transcript_82982:998-1654(+)
MRDRRSAGLRHRRGAGLRHRRGAGLGKRSGLRLRCRRCSRKQGCCRGWRCRRGRRCRCRIGRRGCRRRGCYRRRCRPLGQADILRCSLRSRCCGGGLRGRFRLEAAQSSHGLCEETFSTLLHRLLALEGLAYHAVLGALSGGRRETNRIVGTSTSICQRPCRRLGGAVPQCLDEAGEGLYCSPPLVHCRSRGTLLCDCGCSGLPAGQVQSRTIVDVVW